MDTVFFFQARQYGIAAKRREFDGLLRFAGEAGWHVQEIPFGTDGRKVRAMIDPKGRPVREAKPSYPVEILGLQSVPMAGDEFRVFQDDRDARSLADERALKARIEEQNKVKHVTLENLFATMEDAEVKELNLIIKADVMGSIEALEDSLAKMDQSEVRINVIHSAVGAISETDVVLADADH